MVDTAPYRPTHSPSGSTGTTFTTLHGVPQRDPPPEGQPTYILDPQGARRAHHKTGAMSVACDLLKAG